MAKACDLFVGMTSMDCLSSLFQTAGAPLTQQIFAGLYALYNIVAILPLTALWVRRLHVVIFRHHGRSHPRDGTDTGEEQSESVHLVPRAVRLQEGAGVCKFV